MAAPDGTRINPYNDNRTADADPNHIWDSQYWSLWVTDGGGGTFKDIWTPSPYAHAGIYVSDTETPGRIYAMSVEHHVRNEVIVRNVAAPTRVGQGETFRLEIAAESTTATPATLRVLGDGAVVYEEAVQLQTGANNFVVRLTAAAPAFARYRVQLSPPAAADTFPQNNELAAFTEITGQPRVLIVAADPLDGSSNVDANVSFGMIFSILPRQPAAKGEAAFLRPGSHQLAAGIVIYGPATVLVVTVG